MKNWGVEMIVALVILGIIIVGSVFSMWVDGVFGGWSHLCMPPRATQRRLGRTWQCSCGTQYIYKEDMKYDGNGPSFYREKVG